MYVKCILYTLLSRPTNAKYIYIYIYIYKYIYFNITFILIIFNPLILLSSNFKIL